MEQIVMELLEQAFLFIERVQKLALDGCIDMESYYSMTNVKMQFVTDMVNSTELRFNGNIRSRLDSTQFNHCYLSGLMKKVSGR